MVKIKNGFVIPGKNQISALLDIVRTITRKTERSLIKVDKKYPVILIRKFTSIDCLIICLF